MMTERNRFDLLEKGQLVEVKEVLQGQKNLSLILEVEIGGQAIECLYRPEDGVSLSFDPRVEKPKELYRDILYHDIDTILGFGVSTPVVPWSLAQDSKGVIRPYWREVETIQPWHLNGELEENPVFWERVAILDYICAVVDRNCGDYINSPDGEFIADSGISFVEGIMFAYQSSVVREALAGLPVSEDNIQRLKSKKEEILTRSRTDLDDNELRSLCRRIELMMFRKELL